MDPREFCHLAEKLAQSDTPAHCRTAISRAYYAVYNSAVGLLEDMGFEIEKGPLGHKDVRRRLFYSGDSDAREVGSQLKDLEGHRVRADYRMDHPEVERTRNARSNVVLATSMIGKLDKAVEDPTRRARMVQGITKYDEKFRDELLKRE